MLLGWRMGEGVILTTQTSNANHLENTVRNSSEKLKTVQSGDDDFSYKVILLFWL